MKKIFFLLSVTFFSSQTMAAAWRYGCIGTLPDGSTVNFNREKLAIVSTSQPALYAATADISKEIRVGDALDPNSGLETEMEFRNAEGEIIKLVQTRSVRTANRERTERCTGSAVRSLIDERFNKTYKFIIPGSTTVRGNLKCYDITISTCG